MKRIPDSYVLKEGRFLGKVYVFYDIYQGVNEHTVQGRISIPVLTTSINNANWESFNRTLDSISKRFQDTLDGAYRAIGGMGSSPTVIDSEIYAFVLSFEEKGSEKVQISRSFHFTYPSYYVAEDIDNVFKIVVRKTESISL